MARIRSREVYDFLIPGGYPQTGQHSVAPMILLVPAHPGVLGILQMHRRVSACPRGTRTHLGFCSTKLVAASETHRPAQAEAPGGSGHHQISSCSQNLKRDPVSSAGGRLLQKGSFHRVSGPQGGLGKAGVRGAELSAPTGTPVTQPVLSPLSPPSGCLCQAPDLYSRQPEHPAPQDGNRAILPSLSPSRSRGWGHQAGEQTLT